MAVNPCSLDGRIRLANWLIGHVLAALTHDAAACMMEATKIAMLPTTSATFAPHNACRLPPVGLVGRSISHEHKNPPTSLRAIHEGKRQHLRSVGKGADHVKDVHRTFLKRLWSSIFAKAHGCAVSIVRSLQHRPVKGTWSGFCGLVCLPEPKGLCVWQRYYPSYLSMQPGRIRPKTVQGSGTIVAKISSL